MLASSLPHEVVLFKMLNLHTAFLPLKVGKNLCNQKAWTWKQQQPGWNRLQCWKNKTNLSTNCVCSTECSVSWHQSGSPEMAAFVQLLPANRSWLYTLVMHSNLETVRCLSTFIISRCLTLPVKKYSKVCQMVAVTHGFVQVRAWICLDNGGGLKWTNRFWAIT